MPDAHVLGLPLVLGDGDDAALAQPLSALVIAKCFDPGAELSVSYAVRSTAGLSVVEALGLARYAVLRLERAMERGWGRGND